MTCYVTTEELCAESGLSRADLWELEVARLLLPTQTNPGPATAPGW